MPFMQRLTWDGIALHGGALPGYPASHGCVRLPHAFAEKLFGETRTGDTVVVANAKASAPSIAYPAALAPVAGDGSPAFPHDIHGGYYWNQTLADAPGPVSVLVSLADRRVFALRNGAPFAEAALDVADGFSVGGSVLMVVDEAAVGAAAGGLGEESPRRRWNAYPIRGVDAGALAMLQLRLRARPLGVDPAFARRLDALLQPGSTLLLTDLPAVRPDPDVPALRPVLESDDDPPR